MAAQLQTARAVEIAGHLFTSIAVTLIAGFAPLEGHFHFQNFRMCVILWRFPATCAEPLEGRSDNGSRDGAGSSRAVERARHDLAAAAHIPAAAREGRRDFFYLNRP
jgi:hypothetical protein